MTDITNKLFERVVLVTRPTELDELVARFNTAAQARFYLQQAGQDFSRIEQADSIYRAALVKVKQAIPSDTKLQILTLELVPRFDFNSSDLVVVIGQDGLVANTARYLGGQPIFAINPNPGLYDGVLLAFSSDNFKPLLLQALAGKWDAKSVTMAKVETSDGQSLLAFNDFFIGASSHVSARYELEFDGKSEVQSSSGIIVSTGVGSTGWLKSVYQGASNVASSLGGKIELAENGVALPWNTKKLPFVVREPFPSKSTGADLTVGAVTSQTPLVIHSRMATNGVIFSDGIEADYIAFNQGMSATITIAPVKAALIY